MSDQRVFPSHRYHEQLGNVVVYNQAQHEKLESEGWVESPADFESAKKEVKTESPLEKVQRELAQLEGEQEGEVTKDAEPPAGTPLSESEVRQILLNEGHSKKELKGLSYQEMVELLPKG